MASPGSSSRGGLSEDDLVITFPGRQTFVASEFRAELQQQYYTYAISTWVSTYRTRVHVRKYTDSPLCRPAVTMTGRGVVDAAIGAVLLGVGVLAHGAPCDVALARWAVVFGAVLLVLGPGSLAVGTAAACRRDAMDALGLSIATGVVSAVNFSLIAWGAVLAFGGGRWDAMMARSPQAPLPCTPSLYTPTAIALVIAWVFLGARGPVQAPSTPRV